MIKKLALLFFSFSTVILISIRLVIGGWDELMLLPLGMSILSGLALISYPVKLIVNVIFSAHRFESKKRFATGLSIAFIATVLLVLGFSKLMNPIDLSYSQKNSLSNKAKNKIKAIKEEVNIEFHHLKNDISNIKSKLQRIINPFLKENSKISFSYMPLLNKEGLSSFSTKESLKTKLIVRKGDVQLEVHPPINEQSIFNTIKNLDTKKDKVYFLYGHGEPVKAQREKYYVRLFDFLEANQYSAIHFDFKNKAIPKDADLVVILSPNNYFLPSELNFLRAYLRSGGRLLLALEPGKRHNLSLLTKSFGVEYANNVLVNKEKKSTEIIIDGASKENKIFRSLKTKRFVFSSVSEVRRAPQDKNHNVKEILKTSKELGSKSLAAISDGYYNGKMYSMAVLGDVDLFSDKYFYAYSNYNLISKILIYLSKNKSFEELPQSEVFLAKFNLNKYLRIFFVLLLIMIPLSFISLSIYLYKGLHYEK